MLLYAVEKVRAFWEAHRWRVEDLAHEPGLLSAEPLQELFFCLLGGFGITFESNLAAFQLLRERGLLEPNAFEDEIKQQAEISAALSEKLLHPSGNRTTRYRFPNAKSRTLVSAARWVRDSFGWDLDQLRAFEPRQAREILTTCPGIGYKTASWYLRNIGHGRGLAIIDVHVERVCKEWAVLPHGLCPSRDYLEMEQRIGLVCQAVPAPIEIIDLILWQYSRGDLVERTGQARLF